MSASFSPPRLTASSKITLNNGVQMPVIGSGSAAPPPESPAKVKDWLLGALKNGYRHIDTAQIYGTERAVGEAIRASGIPRQEVFVTTNWTHHGRVREAVEKSLQTLGTEYIDLYLIHWPQAFAYQDATTILPRNPDGTPAMDTSVTFHDSWAEMEKLLEEGKVRAIGVSNFSIKTLEELSKTAKVVPAVNQVELHPYLAQNELRDYCNKRGIVLSAYSPSGYAVVRNDPHLRQLAEKYKVSTTQHQEKVS